MKLQKDKDLGIVLSALLSVAEEFSTQSIKKLYEQNGREFDQNSYNQLLSEQSLEKLESAIMKEDVSVAPIDTTKSSSKVEETVKPKEAPVVSIAEFEDLF